MSAADRLAEAQGTVALIEQMLDGEAELRLAGDRHAQRRARFLRDERDAAEAVITDLERGPKVQQAAQPIREPGT